MKKYILVLLLLLLMTGCGRTEEEATPLTPTPTQVVTAEKNVYDDYIADIEARSDAMKKSLAEDDLTQFDLNMKSKELYDLWDGALNYLWGELKNAMPADEFATLTEEQLLWIAEKERSLADAGKPYEGGSIYALIVNSEAAAITEARVYELYGLLKG